MLTQRSQLQETPEVIEFIYKKLKNKQNHTLYYLGIGK